MRAEGGRLRADGRRKREEGRGKREEGRCDLKSFKQLHYQKLAINLSLIAFVYRETNVNNLCEKDCKITKNEEKVQK